MEVNNRIRIPAQLRTEYLNHLSNRLDNLTTQLQCQPQPHAKRDKKATKHTAAGVLTYTIKDGKPHILLSQRVRQEWWDNFGGKSENIDGTLLMTAIREVSEESNNQLTYFKQTLENSPFHDIVTEKKGKQFTYRMYICETGNTLDLTKIHNSEHTNHCWVSLDALLIALKENKFIQIEDQQTIEISIDNKKITLFPPLYHMLNQPPVLANLYQLQLIKPMKPTATLGYGKYTNIANSCHTMYRPLQTPISKRAQISKTMQHKNKMLRELKKKLEKRNYRGKFIKFIKENNAQIHKSTIETSQSEIHLKAVLGEQYKEGQLEKNVSLFIDQYGEDLKIKENKQALITQCIKLIQNEKENTDKVFFYHGVNNEVGFIYDVYTALYQILQANERWHALRSDNPRLKKFDNINKFIDHYSNNGKEKINNNTDNYNDYAISTNVFLFGNHYLNSSNSIRYMLSNNVARNIQPKKILEDIFSSFQITISEINHLLSLYDQYIKKTSGRLYQLRLSQEDASKMSYAALGRGVTNPLKRRDGQTTLDVNEIIRCFKHCSDFTKEERNYITDLQARLMVPPQLFLQADIINWKPLPDDQQKEYEQALTKVVNAFAYQILNYHTHKAAAHTNSFLIKRLSSILADNDLNYIMTSFSDYSIILKNLLFAIRNNDASKIKEIIEQSPQLLEIKNWHAANSCFKNKAKEIYAEYIFKFIELLPEEYRFKVAMQSKVGSFTRLKVIIQLLPQENRIEFAVKYKNLINLGHGIEEIVALINTEQAKRRFVLAIVDDIKTLAQALRYFDEDERFNISNQFMPQFNIKNSFVLKPIPLATK